MNNFGIKRQLFIKKGGLPQIILDFGVELEGLRPAVALTDGLDNLQDVGGYGALGAMVLVVLVTAIVVDECTFDGELRMVRHVIIEVFTHTKGHSDDLVLTIAVTLALGNLAVPGVHGHDGDLVSIHILSNLPAQTSLVQRTLIGKTDEVMFGFFSKNGFFLFHNRIFLVQIYEKMCLTPRKFSEKI